MGLYLYVCVTCQNAGQTWPKMMFGKGNLFDYSESATGSCGRVHSCAEAGTALGWCLIFIPGCHQPSIELPSLPLAPGSASLGASCSSSVFVFSEPLPGSSASLGTGFGPTGGLCHPGDTAAVTCPQQGRGWAGGLRSSLGSTLHFVQRAGKLHSLRYLCEDEVLMSSAGIHCQCLLWRMSCCSFSSSCVSPNCFSLLTSLEHLPHCASCWSFLWWGTLHFALSLLLFAFLCWFWFFLSSHLLLFFLLPVISRWFSSYCSHGRITGPSASRCRVGEITLPK